jgi:hypothetical protein
MPVFSRPLQSSSAANSSAGPPVPDPFFGAQQGHNKNLGVPDVSPRRPSEGWLRNPAWIGSSSLVFIMPLNLLAITDGGINPPHFYYSHGEIEAAHQAYGEPGPNLSNTQPSQEPAIAPTLSSSDSANPVVQSVIDVDSGMLFLYDLPSSFDFIGSFSRKNRPPHQRINCLLCYQQKPGFQPRQVGHEETSKHQIRLHQHRKHLPH